MHYAWIVSLLAVGLLAALLLLLEIGHRIGVRHTAKGDDRTGVGAVEGAVFALLGLLIAFTFSGAASRFDDRRQLAVEENNAIGTAYLRLDLLPAAQRSSLRELFLQYVDLRIKTYRLLPDVEAARREHAKAAGLQGEIWDRATTACRTETSSSTAMLLLPALNQMFDIANARVLATWIHPPIAIFGLLIVLTLFGAFLAGYGMAGKARHWIHRLAFSFIMAATVYVIFDIEYPRLGLIRVDDFDRTMVELREGLR